jgi:hypothetical protein
MDRTWFSDTGGCLRTARATVDEIAAYLDNIYNYIQC